MHGKQDWVDIVSEREFTREGKIAGKTGELKKCKDMRSRFV